MIGRQGDHVAALADRAIQVVEQTANRDVEVGEHVLHLMTARAVLVADVVER